MADVPPCFVPELRARREAVRELATRQKDENQENREAMTKTSKKVLE